MPGTQGAGDEIGGIRQLVFDAAQALRAGAPYQAVRNAEREQGQHDAQRGRHRPARARKEDQQGGCQGAAEEALDRQLAAGLDEQCIEPLKWRNLLQQSIEAVMDAETALLEDRDALAAPPAPA